MSLTVSLLAPMAAMFGPGAPATGDSPVEPGSDSRRFAEIYVTSGVCALMGYEVDFDALTAAKNAMRDDMVSTGQSTSEAATQIGRDIQFAQGRFTRTYGDFLVETAVWPAGAINSSIQHVTFHQTYQRRCAKLAASSDGGPFLSAPAQRLSRFEIDDNIREVMQPRPDEG